MSTTESPPPDADRQGCPLPHTHTGVGLETVDLCKQRFGILQRFFHAEMESRVWDVEIGFRKTCAAARGRLDPNVVKFTTSESREKGVCSNHETSRESTPVKHVCERKKDAVCQLQKPTTTRGGKFLSRTSLSIVAPTITTSSTILKQAHRV